MEVAHKAAQRTIMEQVEAAATVILDRDEEVLEEPQQQTVRRGGVSAEAIQEEDLGDYVKKVNRY